MRVRDVRLDRIGSAAVLHATVDARALGSEGFHLECSWQNVDPDKALRIGDALLAFLLLPAMAYSEPLDLGNLPVSRKLLEGLDLLQDIYVDWSAGLSHIQVNAAPEVHTGGGDGTALFFSGGVDSWYSFLTSESEGFVPTHLLFLIGFDMPENQPQRIAAAQEVAEGVASELNATLVISKCNLRDLTNPLIDWRLCHGSYLAGVALALGAEISRCFIPATVSPTSMSTWGSHPQLDPLWGTEGLAISDSGFGANRLEKVRRVSESKAALSTLRVCWQSEDVYNCSRCSKCALTMTLLFVIDKLDEADTFRGPINLRAVAKADAIFELSERRTAILATIPLAKAKNDVKLVRALKKAMRPKYRRPYLYWQHTLWRLKGGRKPRAVLRLRSDWTIPPSTPQRNPMR